MQLWRLWMRLLISKAQPPVHLQSLLRSCRALMPRQYPQKKGWNVSSAKLESQDTPFSSHGIAARGERPLPQCQTGRSPWDLLRWHGDLAAGRSQNRLARCGSLSCPLPQHLPMPLLLLLPACACACACQLSEIFSKKNHLPNKVRWTVGGYLGHLKRARQRHGCTVSQLCRPECPSLTDQQLAKSDFAKIHFSLTRLISLLPTE